jgi:hypothetical protein
MRRDGFFLLFVAVAAGLAAFAVSQSRIGRMPGSASRAADAVVTRTDCPNHAVVFYQFDVGGHAISGSNSSASCQSSAPGSRIKVWYSDRDPTISSLTSPVADHAGAGAFGLIALAFAGLAAMLVYVRLRLRRWR